MAPAVAILCQRLLLPRCRCCCCPLLYGRSVVMSQCMKTICLPLMKVLCGLWESSGGPSRRNDHVEQNVVAAALMPYVGCSGLWMCASWSVLSTYDIFAAFVSLHVICGEQTVIPVPEVSLGHSISLLTATAAPLQGPSAFHWFQIFPNPILLRHQRCGCDHRRCLLLPEITKAPSVTASISSLSPSTTATFTTQRSSRTILLVSAPIRPQEHTLQIAQQLQLSRPFLHFLSCLKQTIRLWLWQNKYYRSYGEARLQQSCCCCAS
jgi:hypothetical protein